jgi:hypothetical protein
MKWHLGLAAVVVCSASVACGDDPPRSHGNDGGDGGQGAVGGGNGGGNGGSAVGGMGNGGMGNGGMGAGGSGPGTCSGAQIPSGCGKPQSVVRVLATLGSGSASGPLRVTLAHLRLGNAGTGGVYHTDASSAPVTLGGGESTELQFDMCSGGEMWSEDNCEFNLWGYIDANGNGVLDVGEPAGRSVVSLSCTAAGAACVELALDCVDGTSCVAFQDPGSCSCAQPSCNSPISTCQ